MRRCPQAALVPLAENAGPQGLGLPACLWVDGHIDEGGPPAGQRLPQRGMQVGCSVHRHTPATKGFCQEVVLGPRDKGSGWGVIGVPRCAQEDRVQTHGQAWSLRMREWIVHAEQHFVGQTARVMHGSRQPTDTTRCRAAWGPQQLDPAAIRPRHPPAARPSAASSCSACSLRSPPYTPPLLKITSVTGRQYLRQRQQGERGQEWWRRWHTWWAQPATRSSLFVFLGGGGGDQRDAHSLLFLATPKNHTGPLTCAQPALDHHHSLRGPLLPPTDPQTLETLDHLQMVSTSMALKPKALSPSTATTWLVGSTTAVGAGGQEADVS